MFAPRLLEKVRDRGNRSGVFAFKFERERERELARECSLLLSQTMRKDGLVSLCAWSMLNVESQISLGPPLWVSSVIYSMITTSTGAGQLNCYIFSALV